MRLLSQVHIAVVLLTALAAGSNGEAAGPWRGQIVDADTSQPLEGVVVVAVWEKLSPGVVHRARDFHDVAEAVTDAEGQFVLPARNLSSLNPFVEIEGPRLTVFKGGYGDWRFRRAWLLGFGSRVPSFEEALKIFGETGAVFELLPLKSRTERRNALPYLPFGVPNSRVPKFLEAVRKERVYLGFSP